MKLYIYWKKQTLNRKWTAPKRVRIRPKYRTTVAFSWQEDKYGTNKTNFANKYDIANQKMNQYIYKAQNGKNLWR